jgi:hypothetical protein
MTKLFLFFLPLCCALCADAVRRGDSRESVIAELGEPNGSMKQENMEVLLFTKGTVTLHNGVVTQSDISDQYLRQAEERARRAAQQQKEKEEEQEKQKALYPQDSLSAVVCSYDRSEDWSRLPEFIRPVKGQGRYFIYLPPGYYDSETRSYPCLFVEHPAQWESLRDRIRSEEWAAVILDEQQGENLGQRMNSRFLAAYDDAVERFHISRRMLFTAGGVPSLLYATMRPVAGVILQEPDFDGLRRFDPPIDLLRENADLRVYALLGAKNEADLRRQAQFITEKIPKHFIAVYDGYTNLLPPNLAEQALDWMKKEYRLR